MLFEKVRKAPPIAETAPDCLRNHAGEHVPYDGYADRVDCRLPLVLGSTVPRLDQSRDRQVLINFASSGASFQLVPDFGLRNSYKLGRLR